MLRWFFNFIRIFIVKKNTFKVPACFSENSYSFWRFYRKPHQNFQHGQLLKKNWKPQFSLWKCRQTIIRLWFWKVIPKPDSKFLEFSIIVSGLRNKQFTESQAASWMVSLRNFKISKKNLRSKRNLEFILIWPLEPSKKLFISWTVDTRNVNML